MDSLKLGRTPPYFPLIAVLILQSLLFFANLSPRPIWPHGLPTLLAANMPIPEMLAALRVDIHPPLYYLLLHFWPWRALAGLRAFSVIWALSATVALDRLWLKQSAPRVR